MKKKFPDCGNTPLGLYPIVDSAAWVKRLLLLGVKTIQLRIKDASVDIEDEIQKSVVLAEQYSVRLFINDYWELAIRHNAYGVHLGQEDLQQADLEKIQQAGLRLGVSTHCEEEVARAVAVQPSYIACGPIFPTTTKVMPFSPQGIAGLAHWQRTLDYPIVAIGGINEERMPSVLATKVDGVALITAITQADDPIAATRRLLGYF